MANAFVEYFNNTVSIIKERGAWYRILTFLVLSIVYQFSVSAFGKSFGAEPNIPALLLAVFTFILILGYSIQVMSNRMNKLDKLIPEIDFLKFFVNGIKSIPFAIVWIIYIALTGFVFGVLFGALIGFFGLISKILSFPTPILAFILIAITLPLIIFIISPYLAMYALFSKDFSYKSLNPTLYFKLFPRTATKILAAYLSAILAILAFSTIGYILFSIFSGAYASLQPEVKYVLLTAIGLIIGYLYQVFTFALSCSIANITYDATKGIEENDNDKKGTKSDSSFNDVVDIDYNNYMRNKDENE